MATDERIVAAVTPIVPICEPDEYTPESGEVVAEEYCTYNVDSIPIVFGDDGTRYTRELVQVHWYLPLGRRPTEKRLELCRALQAAGFTYPSVQNASDRDGQHWVFECETTAEA